MIELTEEEQEVLFHTLGLNYGKTIFRNMFLAGEGHHDLPTLKSLVQKGLMQEGQKANLGVYYHATERGHREALAMKKEMEPKLTRSQARYRRYLNADTGDTFIQYLLSRGSEA